MTKEEFKSAWESHINQIRELESNLSILSINETLPGNIRAMAKSHQLKVNDARMTILEAIDFSTENYHV